MEREKTTFQVINSSNKSYDYLIVKTARFQTYHFVSFCIWKIPIYHMKWILSKHDLKSMKNNQINKKEVQKKQKHFLSYKYQIRFSLHSN